MRQFCRSFRERGMTKELKDFMYLKLKAKCKKIHGMILAFSDISLCKRFENLKNYMRIKVSVQLAMTVSE